MFVTVTFEVMVVVTCVGVVEVVGKVELVCDNVDVFELVPVWLEVVVVPFESVSMSISSLYMVKFP